MACSPILQSSTTAVAKRWRYARECSSDVPAEYPACAHRRRRGALARRGALHAARDSAAAGAGDRVLELGHGAPRQLADDALSLRRRVQGAGVAAGSRGHHGGVDRGLDAGATGAWAFDPAGGVRPARHDHGDRSLRLSPGLADAYPVGGDDAPPAMPRSRQAVTRLGYTAALIRR